MSDREVEFMRAAIAASLKSRSDATGAVPRVGAVAVIDDEIVGVAYREEFEPGQHAEYVLLQKHLPEHLLVNATIYTTLEPCTRRGKTRQGEDKIPCVERLIRRKVARVVIGMLDPNPIVRGLGFRMLRDANIRAEVFPHDMMAQVEAINRDFVRSIEANPLHQATQAIAVLAVKANHPLQRIAVERTLTDSLAALRRIENGQIPIQGKEAGYFHRWIEAVEDFAGPERVKAYIRIPSFDPDDLLTKNWYRGFYARLRELVKSGKLSIRYVFLLGTNVPTSQTAKFLDSFKDFAEEIRIVDQKGDSLSPDLLRPSIVLFQNRRSAFTHDRADNAALTEADEWVLEHNYERLSRKFATIELASSLYFQNAPASLDTTMEQI